jgi:3'(2'), 5'-bisphosphate nucleotidase
MMLDTRNPETAFAIALVRESAALAARVQSGMAMMNLTKSDFSPVTVADYAVQALAARRLKDAFPEDRLIGEERSDALRTDEGAEMLEVIVRFLGRHIEGVSGEDACAWIDRGAAAPGGRFWVLDPVDGTKGYLRGGQYAVALALIEEGQVVLGALGCPNLGVDGRAALLGEGALAVARRGEGAWICPLDGEADPAPLKVSACETMAEARLLRSVEAAHTNTGLIGEIALKLGIEADPVLMDSQAKYITLAAGHGELLLRLLSPKQPDYKEKIWDQAAGSIILEEAGGRITDLTGKNLDFSRGRTLSANTGVLASNGPLHDAGLRAIAESGAA